MPLAVKLPLRVLVIERSVLRTVVCSDAPSFVLFGSPAWVTEADELSGDAAEAPIARVTETVELARAASAPVGRVQVTAPEAEPQLQPLPDAETKVVPAGRGALSVIGCVLDRSLELLVTV